MTRARDLADSADKTISGTFTVDNLTTAIVDVSNEIQLEGAAGNDGLIQKNASSGRDELQIYSGGDAYSTGSRGAGIHLYGNSDSEHAGNFAVLTGTNDNGDGRLIVSGRVDKTHVTIGNSIWNYVDNGNDPALLNLYNPTSQPAILIEGANADEGDIVTIDGEALQFGHWNKSTSTFTERLRINSSGDTVVQSGNKIQLNRADNSRNMKLFTDNNAGTIQTSFDPIKIDGQGYIRFDIAASEKARLNSSGSFLVGKTNDADANAGVRVRGDGLVQATRANADPISANRTGNLGDVIAVRSDGSLRGTIGVEYTDNLFIAGDSSHVGLGFGSSAIYPSHGDSTTSSGDTTLGSSNNQFKDLYLSGGVYLGGTGSSNFLQDYVEGTYSYTLTCSTSGSESIRSGYGKFAYTKIGRMVKILGRYELNSSSGAVGSLRWSLPFTQTNSLADQADTGVGTVSIFRSGTQFETVLRGVVYPGNNFFNAVRQTGSGSESLVSGDQVDANYEGFIEITMIVD